MRAKPAHRAQLPVNRAIRRVAACAAVTLAATVGCNIMPDTPRTPAPPSGRTGGGWLIGTVISIVVVDSTASTLVNVHATDGKMDPGNEDRWVGSAFEGALEDTSVVVRVIMAGTSHPEIRVGEKIKADCGEVNEILMGAAVFFHDCEVTDLGT